MTMQDVSHLMGYAEKIDLLSRLGLVTDDDAELCEALAVLQDITHDYASQLKTALEQIAARTRAPRTDDPEEGQP